MGNANVTEMMVSRNTETRESLEISGSKRNQMQQAVEYFTDLQTELCNEVATKEDLGEQIKKLQAAIKSSPMIKNLKALQKELKSKSANITEINSRRSGALGLCKKQGLDLQKVLKNVIQIEEGGK